MSDILLMLALSVTPPAAVPAWAWGVVCVVGLVGMAWAGARLRRGKK